MLGRRMDQSSADSSISDGRGTATPKLGTSPLCAYVHIIPHNSRWKGCTFSKVTAPCVAYLICAIMFSVLMGYDATMFANGDEAHGSVSWNVRTPRPSYMAKPHPCACTSVFPPRHLNPRKEKLKSVGVAQFMPMSLFGKKKK